MRGISAAELDRSPPYVVRWMLINDEEDEQTGEPRVDTADDIAAVAQLRGVTPEMQQAEALGA